VTFRDVVSASGQGDARRLAREDASRIAVVDRGGPRSVVFQCPCGCAEVLVINVDPALKKWWELRRTERGLSLVPSVWRTTGCRSHFILWENRVWWCSLRDHEWDELPEDEAWPRELINALRRAWDRYRARRRQSGL